MSKRWPLILWAATVVAAFIFLYYVRATLFPFLASLLLALLLNPWVTMFQRRSGYNRSKAVLLVYLLFFLVTVTLVMWLWKPAFTQAEQLGASMPAAVVNVQKGVRNYLLAHPKWVVRYKVDTLVTQPPPGSGPEWRPYLRKESNEEAVDRLIDRYLGQVSVKIQQLGPTLVTGVLAGGIGLLSQLLNLILIPIITFFLLADLENFKRQAVLLIPKPWRNAIEGIFSDIGHVFYGYIRGLLIAAAMYAIISAVAYTLLGIPYSLVLGLTAGLLYFVPYVGPMVQLALIAVTAFFTPGPHHILFFITMANPLSFSITVVLIAMVVYFTYDQLVTPRVLGRAVGLHPVFAFFAIMSGATLFGIPGMLAAYPVAGSINVLLTRLLPVMQLGNGDEAESLHMPDEEKKHKKE